MKYEVSSDLIYVAILICLCNVEFDCRLREIVISVVSVASPLYSVQTLDAAQIISIPAFASHHIAFTF